MPRGGCWSATSDHPLRPRHETAQGTSGRLPSDPPQATTTRRNAATTALSVNWAAVLADVTQDVTNTYVATNCVGASTVCGVGGGLPASSGLLRITEHPSPQFTCVGCSGSLQALAFNGAPAGAPLFSYSSVTYDETWPIATTASTIVWGAVDTLTYTVANPYGGAGTLSFFPFSQFVYTTVEAGGATFSYIPKVDLKTGGARVVTPSGVTCAGSPGSCGADANLTVPSAVWLTGVMNPNISSHPGGSETITVTVQTNQGVVNPPN